MIYKRTRTFRFTGLLFIFVMCLILIMLLKLIIDRSNSYLKIYIPGNLLYIQLINHSMPVVKASTLDAGALSDSEGNLGKQILKFVDLTIDDTINLVKTKPDLPKDIISNNEPVEEIEDIKNIEDIADTDLPSTEDIEDIAGTEDTIEPFDFNETMVKRNVETKPSPNQSAPQSTDTSAVNSKIKKTLNKLKPEVLIYHTHTTESFSPYGNYTSEPNKNITSVGKIIADQLEVNYGISVAHDTTIHNVSMIKPYERSAKTVSKYLKEYDSFKLIIDLHRDGGTTKATTTSKLNNEGLAKIMFVVAKTSPYFKTNQETVSKLQNLSDKFFPGFCRDVTVYKKAGHYNQDKAPNTVLIEVGSEKNTLEEAQNSAKYIARIIAEYINDK
jgi:stage II sporulation protein P